jgi:hypothetical protein
MRCADHQFFNSPQRISCPGLMPAEQCPVRIRQQDSRHGKRLNKQVVDITAVIIIPALEERLPLK